jgi:hypothetical protein
VPHFKFFHCAQVESKKLVLSKEGLRNIHSTLAQHHTIKHSEESCYENKKYINKIKKYNLTSAVNPHMIISP